MLDRYTGRLETAFYKPLSEAEHVLLNGNDDPDLIETQAFLNLSLGELIQVDITDNFPVDGHIDGVIKYPDDSSHSINAIVKFPSFFERALARVRPRDKDPRATVHLTVR